MNLVDTLKHFNVFQSVGDSWDAVRKGAAPSIPSLIVEDSHLQNFHLNRKRVPYQEKAI